MITSSEDTTETKRYYIMKNVNAVSIVANLISAERTGEKVVKKNFAAKYDISPRTLNRYEAKYRAEAERKLEEATAKISKSGTTVSKGNKDSKKAAAVEIFKSMEGAKRKEIIAEFMDKAGLTKAGAGTYYYNIKKSLSK